MRSEAELNPSPPFPWRVFWFLLAAALGGALGALPYIFSILGQTARFQHELRVPLPAFVVIQTLQLALVFGIAITCGLLLAPKVKVRLPWLQGWLEGEEVREPPGLLKASLPAGLVLGACTVAFTYIYLIPRAPGWPTGANVPVWQRLLASVYGGINEELLMRLFLFSLVLWLVQIISRRSVRGNRGLFWMGNCITALIFAVS